MTSKEHYRVLVVDDEEELVESACFFLDELGFQTYRAFNGEQAFQILSTAQVDVVLTDMQMPGWDGTRLLNEIKKSNQPAPLIFVISGFSDLTEKQATDLGAKRYYSKPVNYETIAREILTLLGQEDPEKPAPRDSARIIVAENDPQQKDAFLSAVKSSQLVDQLQLVHFDNHQELLSKVLAEASTHPIELIVLDTENQEDAFEALETLKLNNSFKEVPIILLGDTLNPSDREKAKNLGAASFYKKPTTPTAWEHLVRSLHQSWIPGLDGHLKKAVGDPQ